MGKIRERIDREITEIEKTAVDRPVKSAVIGIKFNDNKVHWHFPADDTEGKALVKEAMNLYNLETSPPAPLLGKERGGTSGEFKGNERIRMTLHMPLGDRVVFSAAVRDFKQAFPQTRVNLNIQGGDQLWLYNPHLDLELKEFDLELKPGCQEATNKSNARDWHYIHAFRESLEDQIGVKSPMGAIKPDVWLSPDE